ncbi:hypothetical protein [Catenibacterium mitsuokai]
MSKLILLLKSDLKNWYFRKVKKLSPMQIKIAKFMKNVATRSLNLA